MELRNITTFLKAAEMGNFTHAAASLGYSQSTVTIQIKQLEAELGYPLFDRVGRHISLTPQGQAFLHYANQLAVISQQIKTIHTQPDAAVSGSLRVGVLESLFHHILLPLLPGYHSRFPSVTIKTKTDTSEGLFSLLRRNELDIIFTLGQKRLERDCVQVCTQETPICFVAAADSPFNTGRPYSFREVSRLPLILTESNSVYRRELQVAAAQQDIILDPVLEVDNTSAILSLLEYGMGVSLLPEYVIREPVKQGKLLVLDVPDCQISLWQQLFYHKNKWVTPQMSSLLDMLTAAAMSV